MGGWGGERGERRERYKNAQKGNQKDRNLTVDIGYLWRGAWARKADDKEELAHFLCLP